MKTWQIWILPLAIAVLFFLAQALPVPRFEDPVSLDVRVYPVQGPGSYCIIAIDKYGAWDATCAAGELPAMPAPADPGFSG